MAITTTRFKGENDSDILSLGGVKSRDMIQTRHDVGTVSDSDKGIPFEVIQARPVAVCASAASAGTKTATLTDSFPDFTLKNGREIIVYMANENTAAEPSLLVTGTEAIPLECNSWTAGTYLRCKYVDFSLNGTRVRKWLVDTGYTNVTNQLNGALTNLGLKFKQNGWYYRDIDNDYIEVFGQVGTGSLNVGNAYGSIFYATVTFTLPTFNISEVRSVNVTAQHNGVGGVNISSVSTSQIRLILWNATSYNFTTGIICNFHFIAKKSA